jgi:hypothetical protein
LVVAVVEHPEPELVQKQAGQAVAARRLQRVLVLKEYLVKGQRAETV